MMAVLFYIGKKKTGTKIVNTYIRTLLINSLLQAVTPIHPPSFPPILMQISLECDIFYALHVNCSV